ncbi:hypothetical protein NN561_016266 [Cricetulus griseus]
MPGATGPVVRRTHLPAPPPPGACAAQPRTVSRPRVPPWPARPQHWRAGDQSREPRARIPTRDHASPGAVASYLRAGRGGPTRPASRLPQLPAPSWPEPSLSRSLSACRRDTDPATPGVSSRRRPPCAPKAAAGPAGASRMSLGDGGGGSGQSGSGLGAVEGWRLCLARNREEGRQA